MLEESRIDYRRQKNDMVLNHMAKTKVRMERYEKKKIAEEIVRKNNVPIKKRRERFLPSKSNIIPEKWKNYWYNNIENKKPFRRLQFSDHVKEFSNSHDEGLLSTENENNKISKTENSISVIVTKVSYFLFIKMKET